MIHFCSTISAVLKCHTDNIQITSEAINDHSYLKCHKRNTKRSHHSRLFYSLLQLQINSIQLSYDQNTFLKYHKKTQIATAQAMSTKCPSHFTQTTQKSHLQLLRRIHTQRSSHPFNTTAQADGYSFGCGTAWI